MLALESQCLPEVLGGVIILRTMPNRKKSKQEVDAVMCILVNERYSILSLDIKIYLCYAIWVFESYNLSVLYV